MNNATPQQPDTFDTPIAADEMFGDDVGPALSEEETKGALERLATMAEELQAVRAEIEKDTTALAEKQAREGKLKGVLIPELMDKIGMESFTMKDGSKIDVKKDIKCSLSEERKPDGLKWIRENGHGGIIKTEVAISFGKGEEEAAKRAEKVLREAGFSPSAADAVHPATLKSFVKERIEAGDNIPLTTFGVFEFKEAKISLPKAKKKR